MSPSRLLRLSFLLVFVFCISLLSFQSAPAQTDPSPPIDGSLPVEKPPIPMPQGRAQVTLAPTDNPRSLGSLPLQVAVTDQEVAGTLSIEAATLDEATAYDISPVGFAFELHAIPTGQDKSNALETPPLELTLDYSQIPILYGASIKDRLTLYRVSGCKVETVDISPPDRPAREFSSEEVLNCTEWQPLVVQNDRANERLIVDLSQAAQQAPIITETSSALTPPDDAAESAKVPRREPGGPSYYALATLSSGQQGDYSFTPLSAVGEYEVSLSSGAMTTGYPIPVPPPKAGAAPEVTLNYNSALIDGMHTSKNSQPGSVGIGWTVESGAIIRHLKTCNTSWAPGDLCLTGDNFTIILNGVRSRLVKESGTRYRLQDDPHWKVEQKTSSESGHPDRHKTYWLVTTPDGTQYRFGGEIVPETSADQNSVFYTTIYDNTSAGCAGYSYALCDMAWQWNLDRVEDTNDNVINYFYEVETNYYKARNYSSGTFRRQYVRAGHVSRIEYTTTAGQTDAPHARVLFNTELRCTNPTTSAGCDWPSDFPDTPGDLACAATGSCSQNKPTFWSQRRLGSVQTQVYDESNSEWQMVAHYNLDQGFPVPPTDGQGDTSEAKLWLGGISQHPGGDFSRWAFIQHEAEDFDAQSGLQTEVTTDIGQGQNVGWIDGGDYLLFEDLNFDSGATTLTARVASPYSGRTIEFRLAGTTGPLIATVNVPNTGGWQNWQTVETTVSNASGIHDLYIVFPVNNQNFNWFRFGPHFGSGSPLPGLPAVRYEYEMLTNRRNYNVSGVSPMYMPRIDQVQTELGGTVDFTYGQSHACPTSSGSYIRLPYDCFVAWDAGDPNISWDDGWVLWNKWKVLEQESSDTFSGNETETLSFEYSTPTWHYSDDPSLPEINSCSGCPTRHWTDSRGSEIVTVTDSSGAQTEYRFHRGMHGDRLGVSGGTFSANITLSDTSTRQDNNWLRGRAAEIRRLDDQDAPLTRTVNWFTADNTAGSGTYGAYFVGTQKTEETLVGTANKTTRTEYEFDDYGNLSREILHGDTSTTDDDRNLETGYLYNTGDYIVDRPMWSALWAGTTPGGTVGGEDYVCTAYPSSDVPKYISPSGTPTVTSNLTISDSGTIEDLNVLDLNGTHTWFANLGFKLTSAENTTVQIMWPSCGNHDNFDLNLDDEAAPGSWPCPPTGGGTYRPSNSLSTFDGQEMNGTWKLTVNDNYNYDGGYLNGWSVEVCRTVSLPPAPTGDELALTMYAYDGGSVGDLPTKGNMTLERAYSQVTPSSEYSDTTFTYDGKGRPATTTNPNNNTTTTTYHSFYGYAQTVTNALNHVVTTVMDPGWGVATEVTDANNKVTTIEYDEYGRLTDVWLPSESTSGPASMVYEYHPEARPAYVQGRTLRDTTSSAYLDLWTYVDGFGREIQSQRPSVTANMRVVSSRQMNDLGQLKHQSMPYEISGTAGSGYVQPTWSNIDSYQRFSYDELGRSILQEQMSSGSALWSTASNYDGWTTQYTDANGHDTDNEVDAFGQLVEVTEYNDEGSGQVSYTTTYEYDLLGNLSEVTDHLSHVTTMGYDLLGRKTAMSDPDMGSWAYQYDAGGNLTAQQDGRGQWIYMAYDDLNRVTGKRRDSAGGSLIAEYFYDSGDKGYPDGSKSYDNSGVTVNVEVQLLGRDDRYRVTQQQWIVNGQGSFKMGYGYDEANNLLSVQYPSNNSGGLGEVVSRTYNSVGQLDQVIAGQDNTHIVDSVTYNPDGQVASLRLDQGGNGATIGYTYESGSLRLSQKEAGSGSGGTINLQDLSYSYDDAGNVTAITDAVNSGQVLSFDYDWLNRLTSAGTTSTGTGQYNHTYAYDAIGNIISNNGNSYTYSTTQPHAVTAAFGNSYGYDANGNQTSRTIASTAYTQVFDYENRLVEVKQGSTPIGTFIYDAGGNRVVGTVAGTTTVYIAGLFEYQGGAMTRYYAGPDGPVALRRVGYGGDNGIFYLLDDHLNSTGVILKQDGTVSAQQYYYPFGGNRDGAFSSITTKRFTGQYHEAGLPGGEGLSYYNARWYDAQLGRFVSADTLVPQPWNPQSINRFSYVHNNPLKYVDPSGHALVIGACRSCGGTTSIPDYAPPPISVPQTTWNEWGSYRGQQRVNALNEWITYFRYKAVILGSNYRMNGGKTGATFGQMIGNLEHDRKLTTTNMGGWKAVGRVIDENPELFALGAMTTSTNWIGSNRPLKAGDVGSYNSLKSRERVGDNLEHHHIPQAGHQFTTYGEGGAIELPRNIHVQTRTYGVKGVQALNADQTKSFRTIVATDIWNLRSIVGSEYNKSLLKLLDYYRNNFPGLMKK